MGLLQKREIWSRKTEEAAPFRLEREFKARSWVEKKRNCDERNRAK
jgi:hypothetical protein